jgi:glycosyltransferase involved in cell wall biosynthesis
MKEIYDLLKRERPDILFLCSTTAGLLGSIASFFYKLRTSNFELRTIYRIGGWAFKDPRNFVLNKILLWLEKLTAPLKDKIIVNSEIDHQIAIKSKICPAEKIVKIYNGIDVNELKFLPKEEAREILLSKIPNSKLRIANFIIGCVANFYKTKGLPYLIKAAKIISINQPNQHKSAFLIIGEGKERKKLESLIKKYNLENNVFLLGRIPDAYRYLKAFDIFVLPSLKEGFPWIILEAMAAEVPIISTNVGAISEIIENGVDGLLVEPKNSQALAKKIIWLIKNQEKAKEMTIKAKEKLKEFSLEKMIEETVKLLDTD